MNSRWHTRRARSGVRSPVPCVVFRWDLDKTYLKSEFDRMRDLVRIPFESAADKIAAPGVAALIRELRATAEKRRQQVRVYFVTASPPQIGRAIKEKLTLDGIRYDDIAFKDQLQNLVRGKFRYLREQVGFKLSTLLRSHQQVPDGSREFLFGDDWESDPLVYSLYADVVAGRVERGELEDVLRAIHVDPALMDDIVASLTAVRPRETVARIYINLERRTPPAHFHWFGPRLIPSFNYFQTAACLYGDGVLDADGVVTVARSLVDESGYTAIKLLNSLADVERRGHLRPPEVEAVRRALAGAGLIARKSRARRRRSLPWWDMAAQWKRLVDWVRETAPAPGAPSAPSIDYRELVAQWRPAR
jgi:hypothetical protein